MSTAFLRKWHISDKHLSSCSSLSLILCVYSFSYKKKRFLLLWLTTDFFYFYTHINVAINTICICVFSWKIHLLCPVFIFMAFFTHRFHINSSFSLQLCSRVYMCALCLPIPLLISLLNVFHFFCYSKNAECSTHFCSCFWLCMFSNVSTEYIHVILLY